MTPAVERLLKFVNSAPAGTLIPVDSLRDILRSDITIDVDAEAEYAAAERRLSPGEAAEWLHQLLGGRKRSPAAIRKVMRTGFRGVVLNSYQYGRERRTTETDLRHFVAQIGAVPRPPQLASPSTQDGLTHARVAFQVKSTVDPVNEIAAAQERFRARKKPHTAQRAKHHVKGAGR
jgi:hypothetical protein